MPRDHWEQSLEGSEGSEDEDSGSEYEEVTTVKRTIKKTKYKPRQPEHDPPSYQEKNKKLFGRDLAEYDAMDMDDMLDQLTAEEIEKLTQDVDPDDSLMPPDQRTAYRCNKEATGPLDRKQLIDHINEQALTEPDREEPVPYQPGVIRGKKWVPAPPKMDERLREEGTDDSLEDDDTEVLMEAKENELIDLAAILGFHSMMNQDQYHASLLGKKLDTEEVGWTGITRASRPKPMAPEPPNTTDPETSIERVKQNDPELRHLNLNNIKTISCEQFARLCQAASVNSRLEGLQVSNVGMGDAFAQHLVHLIESNSTIKEICIESNFISPPMIARLVKALLTHKSVETFRAANQRSQVLGNKIEMEITKYIEQNPNLLQLGLHFDFNDARARVSTQLQRNRDRSRALRHHQPGDPLTEAEGAIESDAMSENNFSIQLPATDKLPPRSGGQIVNNNGGADNPDGVADDVLRTADDVAVRTARAAADLALGLTTVSEDARRVADDVGIVSQDVKRLVGDVRTAASDAATAVRDVERVAEQVERDFLDVGGQRG